MPQLEDRLVEGTGSYQRYIPRLGIHKRGEVVPRILPVTVVQTPHYREGDARDALEFIGTPVDDLRLQQIRQFYGFSENYGAVIIPKSLMEKVDPESTRLIVGEVDDSYIVVGLLPTKELRWDARRVTSDEEGIVYTPMSEFPTINPQELMNKWGRFNPSN